MVPKCPICGGAIDMNLRKDQYFVQDEAEERFSDFLTDAMGENLVLLEVGVGFNTPTIIRFPFEKLAREHKNIQMIRLNLDDVAMPEDLDIRGIGIEGDLACVIPQL